MIPLPLLLEPTANYLLMALPLGGTLIGLMGHMVWRARRSGWSNFGPRQWFACVLLGGLGVSLLVQPIGWQLKVDRDGIVLSAPFDLFADRGTIRWNELSTIGFGSTGGRNPQPTVKFVSQIDTVVSLRELEGVPDGYWPALISIIEANAPQAKFDPDADRWLADVRSFARPKPGTLPGGWTYTARDGEGRSVK